MSTTFLNSLADLIPAAATNLAKVIAYTPLQLNERLSEATGAQVWLKREDLQPVRSYKIRGAYNLMSQLSPEERAAGIVCASAGNHAQGVAWSCSRLGINGKIFVPTTTPRQKRERIKSFGRGQIELIISGETYDLASSEAKQYALRSGATLVPAFDDLRIAAGQGTIAYEITQQLGKAPDTLIAPVGGGGMLSGCAAWMRKHYPETRLIGVEPEGAACMAAALAAGHPVTLPNIDTFCDGAAVAKAGDITFPVIQNAKIEMLRVPEGQICTEMLDMYQVDGIIAEPAGALACSILPTAHAGIRTKIPKGSTVVAIISGSNNDVLRYAEIVERSLIHQGRKRYLLVNFPQEPGALRRFLDDILGPDDDITYFEYIKRSNRETGPALVGIELGDSADFPSFLNRLDSSDIQAELISAESPFYRFLV